jgi:hypothetical protein
LFILVLAKQFRTILSQNDSLWQECIAVVRQADGLLKEIANMNYKETFFAFCAGFFAIAFFSAHVSYVQSRSEVFHIRKLYEGMNRTVGGKVDSAFVCFSGANKEKLNKLFTTP